MDGKSGRFSRRDVLQSVGAVGVTGLTATGSVSAMAEADDVRQFSDVQTDTEFGRTVQIKATGKARYTFGVTGLLTAEDAPQSAASDGVASKTINGKAHTYRFTGEFTEFSVKGEARVRVDGEPFDVDAFPHNTLEISPNEEVTYDVSASGAVSVDEGAADQPNVRTATAETSDTHVLSYAGELTHFQIDGDAMLRRNGLRVDATDLLPSTRPHEFTAASRTSDAYTLDITRDCKTQNGVSVETGETAEFTRKTVGRYAGQVTGVEHPSGAQVEIDEVNNEIVASAPADKGAKVRVETTKGLVVDHEAFDSADFSLSAGQEATAVPFGDVVRIVIDEVDIELSRNEYPAAKDSATLQAAAEVERTDAFQRLASIASGRVRYDAAGITGQEVLSDTTTTVRSVEHQLANSPKGDSGVVSVRQTPSGVEHASVRYKRTTGQKIKIDAVILPIGQGTDKLRRETETMTVSQSGTQTVSTDTDYTAEMFANTANPEKNVDADDLGYLESQVTQGDVQTQGFTSFLNDVKSLLEDIGADVYDAATFLYDVLKGQLDKVAVTAQNLVIASPALIASIAEELPSANLSVKAKLAWRVKVAPAVGLAGLASAGFFDALDTGAWCAGCVFLAIFLRDVLASEGASYLCAYIGPALPALVVCIVAAEALIQFGSQYFGYSDVQNQLCDGDVVSEIDPC